MLFCGSFSVAANDAIGLADAVNGNMCAGALEAIKDSTASGDTPSLGVDGTAEACLPIKEGRMTSTSLQSAYDLASTILSTLNKLLTGEETQIDTDIDCPLITMDNVDQYIEMHKKAGAIK